MNETEKKTAETLLTKILATTNAYEAAQFAIAYQALAQGSLWRAQTHSLAKQTPT